MRKSSYFIRSLFRVTSPKICPYCNGTKLSVVDTKYIVTTLNQCPECKLMFRHPVDTVDFNKKFYQEDYEQQDGITTDLPTDEELEKLLASNFIQSGKDYSDKIEILKNLLPKNQKSIIDYGANWGYTSYQLIQAGFQVQSYEISKPRASFGTKLGLSIITNEEQLKSGVDIFFSSHVIEHLPKIKQMFNLAKKMLNEEGYFVAFCPNGSADLKRKDPDLFHHFWGQVHPNCLSAEFFSTVFKDVPYLIGSDSSEYPRSWDGKTQEILDVSGNELFVIAKINQQF